MGSRNRLPRADRKSFTYDPTEAPAHVPASTSTSGSSLGVTVQDLFFVGLTIVVFAALWLIVKGIETFER
jgi:hypothetical protein